MDLPKAGDILAKGGSGRPWAWGWRLHHPGSPGLTPPPLASPRFTVRTWPRLLVLTCWPPTLPTTWSAKG